MLIALWVFLILATIAFWVGVIYAGIHFIHKFW
jgi:hypothetical protein